MESKMKLINGHHILKSFECSSFICMISFVMSMMTFPVRPHAQDHYTTPSWWFGIAPGINFNYYRGSTQSLNNDLSVPKTFHNGQSTNLYLATLVEYRFLNSPWGVSMHIGYDGRGGSFDQVITPCNCPADLHTNLSYLTVEPSVRFGLIGSNLYLFGGPRFAFNLSKSFTYKLGINPQYPDQPPTPDVNGDLSSVRKALVSLQIGAGYDIPLSSESHRVQYLLSPFISFQPYFGQSPRSIETWSLTTLRLGVALKFGFGNKIENQEKVIESVHPAIIPEYNVVFSIAAPKSIPEERKVKEMFPVRNYIFFDTGSTHIPNRYILMDKEQAKGFEESQLNAYKPKSGMTRSERQLVVYYNIMNILGYRMKNNSLTTITLIGSSRNGQTEALAMANSVKQYLVDVYGINATRINTEGLDNPLIPSGPLVDSSDYLLLLEGDRRVSIENTSPLELKDVPGNVDILLQPVNIIAEQKTPPDSYVAFYANGAKQSFTSWYLEITDEKGKLKTFGPYTEDSIQIPGRFILGDKTEGNYSVAMVGHTMQGDTLMRKSMMHLELKKPDSKAEGLRFSVIFEFDESKLTPLYEKYLNENVVPAIPDNCKVILQGHTDIIGKVDHNYELSLGRANYVKNLLENGVNKAGKHDVKFEVLGFGEDQTVSPFANKYPEENFYNRTVIIDIIPEK